MGGFINGFRGKEILENDYPNQGIWHSLSQAVLEGFICFLIFAVVLSILWGPAVGLTLSASLGILAGLLGGGLACIKHFVLRILLYLKGDIPWNLSDFLEAAVEQNLLQRVGGGYIFIHRLLMEHFAQLELDNK